MHYTVIKHSRHFRILEKFRKQSPAARVFRLRLVFSTFRACSQMPVVFYREYLTEPLDRKPARQCVETNVICVIQITSDIRRAICFNALLIINILPLVAIWEMPTGTLTYSMRATLECLKNVARNGIVHLVYEMLYIRTKRPNLNTQSDSIRANLFV